MVSQVRANKTSTTGKKKILYHELINVSGMNDQQSLKIAFERCTSQCSRMRIAGCSK